MYSAAHPYKPVAHPKTDGGLILRKIPRQWYAPGLDVVAERIETTSKTPVARLSSVIMCHLEG